MAKQEKKSLKTGVIETAHAIADAGEVAEGVADTVRTVAPKVTPKGRGAGKTAVKAVAGTVTGAATTVARVGKIAGRVADNLEGSGLQKELARGRMTASKGGAAVEKIVEHVAGTGQPLVILAGGRPAVAVVPYERYKATGTPPRKEPTAPAPGAEKSTPARNTEVSGTAATAAPAKKKTSSGKAAARTSENRSRPAPKKPAGASRKKGTSR